MNDIAENAVIERDPAPLQARQIGGDVGALMQMIERVAMSPDFSVERLNALLDVKERWDANEAKKAFTEAMAAFKADPPTVLKDKDNKQYGSKYASIGNLVNTVSAALGPHGLSPAWNIEQGEKITVTCILTHRLGHSERVSMSGLPDASGQKNPLQQIKSTVTYLKIATFEAVTGIASAEGNADDDGNGSGAAKKEETGLSESAYADHLSAIESAADAESIDKAWAAAAQACHEAHDPKSHAALKGKTIARKAALVAK